MTKRKKIIIASLILALLLAIALVFVFVILPLLKNDVPKDTDNDDKDRTFEIHSIEIQFNEKMITGITKTFDSESFVLSVVVNNGEIDYSQYDEPIIVWGFIGDDLNCTVDNGEIRLGNILGEVTLRVTAKSSNEKSAEIIIEIANLPDSILQSIEIINLPDKLEYIEGQTFDKTGMDVIAHFQNHSIKIAKYTINPNIFTPNNMQVEISYSESGMTKQAYFPISITQKTLQSIEITNDPSKTSYIEGQKFNKAGIEVTAHYEYLSEIITDFYFDEDKILSFGDTSITIFYTVNHPVNGQITKTTVQAISVAHRTLQSISIDSQNAKLNYIQGQTFDKTGLEVIAHFNDGITQVITEYTVDTNTKLTYDITEWVISYEEYSITKKFILSITVDEPYTNFREIVIIDYPNEAMLTWLYSYTTDSDEDVIDYTTYAERGLAYNNPLGTYMVPVGAVVTVSAVNPAITDFLFDSKAQGLAYPARSLDFILEDGDDLLCISFAKISDRITVAFSDGINSIAFSYPRPWSGILREDDLKQIALVFGENDLYGYNVYNINGTDYTFAELSSCVFNVYDAVVTVEKREYEVGTAVTLVYWQGVEVIVRVDLDDPNWQQKLPVPSRIGYEFTGWIEQDNKLIAEWRLINHGYSAPFVGTWYFEVANEVTIECQITLNSNGTYEYKTYVDGELNLSLYGIYEFNQAENKIIILSIETDVKLLLISYNDFNIDINNLLTANVLIVDGYDLYQFVANFSK